MAQFTVRDGKTNVANNVATSTERASTGGIAMAKCLEGIHQPRAVQALKGAPDLMSIGISNIVDVITATVRACDQPKRFLRVSEGQRP